MILRPEGSIQENDRALDHKSLQACAVKLAGAPDLQKQHIWTVLTQPGPPRAKMHPPLTLPQLTLRNIVQWPLAIDGGLIPGPDLLLES